MSRIGIIGCGCRVGNLLFLFKCTCLVKGLVYPLLDIFDTVIKDITCPRVDTNFVFEWSTRCLTSERSELVRYQVEHEKIKFVSTSGHVIFCLLYTHSNDDFFYDFPRISEHFTKIYEDSPKVVRRPDKRFRKFPKITEDIRGRSNDVSITQVHV